LLAVSIENRTVAQFIDARLSGGLLITHFKKKSYVIGVKTKCDFICNCLCRQLSDKQSLAETQVIAREIPLSSSVFCYAIFGAFIVGIIAVHKRLNSIMHEAALYHVLHLKIEDWTS